MILQNISYHVFTKYVISYFYKIKSIESDQNLTNNKECSVGEILLNTVRDFNGNSDRFSQKWLTIFNRI